LKTRHLIILYIFVLCVYWQIVNAGFVLDDIFLIVNNKFLKSDTGLYNLLSSDLWAGEPNPDLNSGYYRPLFLLSIWLDHALHGNSPLGYHIQSLIWHLLNGGLLYYLFVKKLKSPSALFAAALFLVHPLQSEAVYWVSARNDSMAIFFSILALCIFNWDGKDSIWRNLFGGIAIGLALISKESGFIIFPIIGVLLWQKKMIVTRSLIFSMCCPLIVVLSFRFLLDTGTQLPSPERWSFLSDSFLSWAPYVIGRLLYPFPLSSHAAITWLEPNGLWYLSATALVLILVFVSWHKPSRTTAVVGIVSMIFCFFSFVPVMAVHGLIGDRYFGFAVVGLAFVCCQLSTKVTNFGWPILAVFSIIISFRGVDWGSDESIWKAAYKDNPTSFTSVSLAHIYYNQKDYDKAYELYLKGYSESTPYLDGCDLFVVSALKSKGLLVANEKGAWSLKVGCKITGEMAGILGVINIGMREWGAAEEMCQIKKKDFYQRKDLVCAAISFSKGDVEKVEEIRSSWSDVSDFDRQLSTLLFSGGLKPQ
jgi:hypothetical protein